MSDREWASLSDYVSDKILILKNTLLVSEFLTRNLSKSGEQ